MTPTPARAAAAVLSDGELSAALGLWYRLRDDDGTLVETVARALRSARYWSKEWMPERKGAEGLAAALIAAVRGEVR